MRNVAARLKAVKALTDPAALMEALEDPSPLVVEAAAQRLRAPRAAGALHRAYLRLDSGGAALDPGCWARMALLEALAEIGAPEAEDAARCAIRTVQVEPVAGGMADTATGLRTSAPAVLANMSAPGALLDLAILLHDTEPNAPCSPQERLYAKSAPRQAAARAIGALGDPGGGPVLAVKLTYPGEELEEVLAECMDSLVTLQEPRIAEVLAPWLTSHRAYLASVAATALAKAAGAAAIPLLLAALDPESGAAQAARESFVYAIGSIRSDQTREALEGLRNHPDISVVRAVNELV